jgi:hypothetical protein
MIDILSIIILLVVVGFGLWLVEQIPMDATVKRIIIGLAIFLIIIWVLQSLGLFASGGLLSR